MMPTQSWLKGAVIYQILIDRFAGYSHTEGWERPTFLGGNLRGIIDNLPYLEELGVDAIWITPHYETSAYHGYHVTDFFAVDPHFGTLDDFQELVETLHSVGMRLLIDFVPNHVSRQHRFFQEAITDPSSPYRKWFYFTQWPDNYLSFLRMKEIPKLNLAYPAAREYIVEAARFWVSLGVDGLRLDHVIGPSHRFWDYFSKRIKQEFPGVVLLGEAWMMGIRWHEVQTILMRGRYWRWFRRHAYEGLLRSYVGVLDGVLDFGVQHAFRQYFSKVGADVAGFQRWVNRHYQRFPMGYVLPGFVDNHDMDRFLFYIGNNTEVFLEALAVLFRLPQPVILYYGTETGMSQPRSLWDCGSCGDVMARMPMNWEDIDWDVFHRVQHGISDRKQRLR
ncbi:MAG: hypothetical protein KKG04_08180 [Candidatus Thermoplasmatota archaeon]|nr:hypothetical protein [Candidatus Thermoplasmatota archaeon]